MHKEERRLTMRTMEVVIDISAIALPPSQTSGRVQEMRKGNSCSLDTYNDVGLEGT